MSALYDDAANDAQFVEAESSPGEETTSVASTSAQS